MSILDTEREHQATVTPSDRENPLNALAPKAKARRFRRLLPIIEARIAEGVRHADIINALREQGLDLSEATYFTYLQRHRARRKAGVSVTAENAPATRGLRASLDVASTVPASSPVNVVEHRRPPTFEHDPRGDPDLLK